MKKIIALLLALVMLMGLVACGGAAETEETELVITDSPSQSDLTQPAAAEEETEAPAAEEEANDWSQYAGQTVRFYTYPSGGWDAAKFDEFTAPFTELTGIEVETTVIPWGADGAAKMTAAFLAGEGPDVMYVTAETAYDLISNGYLADLTEYLSAECIEDNMYAANTKINGVQYTLPRGFGIGFRGLIFNKSILEAAGVTELPTTRDELVAAAQAIKDAGVCDYPLLCALGGDAENVFSSVLGNIWSGGGDFMTNGEPSFDSAENTATLQWMHDLIYKYEVMSVDCTSLATEDLTELFGAGKVGIAFCCTSWINQGLSEAMDSSEYVFTLGVVPNEGDQVYTFNPVDMLGLNPQSEVIGAAAAFMEWQCSLDGREAYRALRANPLSDLPTNTSQLGLYEPTYDHPDFPDMLDEIGAGGRALPIGKGTQTMLDGMIAEIQLMMLDQQSVEDTVANVQALCIAAQED